MAKKATNKKSVSRRATKRAPQAAAAAKARNGSDPSQHVIVIPPPATFAPPPMAGLAMAAGAAGAMAAPATLKDVLQTRRQQLLAFATMASGLSPMAGMMGAAGAAGGVPRRKPLRGVQVLEAVGALIVDRNSIDTATLQAAAGATILENILIPLAKPVKKGAKSKAKAAKLNLWHLDNINVAAARKKGLTGKGIIAGVLDTGIDAKHPEFKGKKVHFKEFDAGGKPMKTAAYDAGSHGTHVSGLVAGVNVGVAPKANLAVAAVLTFKNSKGQMAGYFAQILGGMNWLLSTNFSGTPDTPGVDVMNASLGGNGYNNYYYQTLANARLATGTLLVASIGNSGPAQNSHGSPGNYDITVGVGAIDQNNDVTSFSDWGVVAQHNNLAKPDVCAPGGAVVSSVPGGGYQSMSGTSMASPVVAGALALLLEQNPGLQLNAVGLEKALNGLVTGLSGATNKKKGGRGRLDLSKI